MSKHHVLAKPFGMETRGDGTQMLSFRVVRGRFPSGPWNDRLALITIETEDEDDESTRYSVGE